MAIVLWQPPLLQRLLDAEAGRTVIEIPQPKITSIGIGVHWTRDVHSDLLPEDKERVLMFMLSMGRLRMGDGPSLPPELWVFILEKTRVYRKMVPLSPKCEIVVMARNFNYLLYDQAGLAGLRYSA
jgi:hypothetical protein